MRNVFLLTILFVMMFAVACGEPASNTSNTNASNANTAPAPMTLTETETPQRIRDMMAQRGEQDQAEPELEIVAPAEGSVVESSTVRVVLELDGELKGYQTGMDHNTGMGNHIHVILDNQPYEAYYNLSREFELRNVQDGEHTLRVFASRPWHESYKNEGSFQMVRFTVKGGGADPSQPTTTNSGQQMSTANAAPTTNANASPANANTTANANAAGTAEGKDMPPSQAGTIDDKLPLLTYSRPKGEYKGDEADPIMIDFWLIGGELVGDGGQYRVRYTINNDEPKFIERWQPLWLQGWTPGKHTVRLELIDKDGNVVDNGGYNSTTREITVLN